MEMVVFSVFTAVIPMNQNSEGMEKRTEGSQYYCVVEISNTPTTNPLEPLPSGRHPVSPAADIRTSRDSGMQK